MSGIGVAAFAAAIAAVILWAPIRWAFATFAATALLVPGHLVIPNGVTDHLTVARFVAVVVLLRVVIEVRAGRAPIEVFRFTRVHGALALAAAYGLVVGVGHAASEVPIDRSLSRWLEIADPLLILFVGLAAMRAVRDPHWIALSLVGALAAAAAIAMVEHFVEWQGFANWWFGDRQQGFATFGLSHRGGVRVRAASAFALEWGWIVAMLMPVTLSLAAGVRHRTGRWLALSIPAGIALAAVYSESRSAIAGLAVGGLGLIMLSRIDRRVTQLTLAGALVGFALWATVPALTRPFEVGREKAEVSTEARIERLEEATGVVVQQGREVEGLGLGGLQAFGILTLDNSYTLTYVEQGVIGVAVFGAVIFAALLAMVPAMRAPPGRLRRLAAAATTGALVALFGGAAYDLHQLPQSLQVFWLLVALAIVIGESLPEPARRPSRIRLSISALVGLPVVALVVGIIVSTSAPTHSRGVWLFETVTVEQSNRARDDGAWGGEALANTICTLANAFEDSQPGVAVDCTFLDAAAGVGTIEIAGATSEVVLDGSVDFFARASAILPGFRTHVMAPVGSDIPTASRTAPLWAPLATAALLGVLVGGRRTRPSSAPRQPASGNSPPNRSQRRAAEPGRRHRDSNDRSVRAEPVRMKSLAPPARKESLSQSSGP